MKSIAAALALAAVAPVALADPLTINTLTGVVQCQPVKLTWSGGTPPYFLSLVPANQPAANPLEQFPVQQGTDLTWDVNLPAGTSFTTVIKDSTGQPNYSSEQTVEAGTDSSCLNGTTTTTGTSGSGAASSTSSSVVLTQTPAAAAVTGLSTSSTSHAATGSTSTTGTATTSHSTGTAAAAANTNAASSSGAFSGLVGLSGVLGLMGAAFL
ncbi:hypothetical protein EIP86_007821 [Pleurotus ostreatoroseus]|nr:hypothetical protein EIP86_007821 [Pleurotus ostreatoroseus]